MTIRHEDEEMVDDGGGVPPVDLQNRIISTHLNKDRFFDYCKENLKLWSQFEKRHQKTLHEGDVWRIIPHKWLESWKLYAKGISSMCPPLDISELFDERGDLLTGLKSRFWLYNTYSFSFIRSSYFCAFYEGKPNRRKTSTTQLFPKKLIPSWTSGMGLEASRNRATTLAES